MKEKHKQIVTNVVTAFKGNLSVIVMNERQGNIKIHSVMIVCTVCEEISNS